MPLKTFLSVIWLQVSLLLSIPLQFVLVQIMVIKVAWWFDDIMVLLLHVGDTCVCHSIKPFGSHVVDITAGIPILLVAVIGMDDDEEGYAGGEDANTVGSGYI